MHKLCLIFMALCLSWQAKAQVDIPLGTWRTHNAYNKTIALASNGQEIIAATNAAIYLYNPEENSSEQITRLSGLSDSEITALGYNSNEEITIVTYGNGNIDLITNTKISNFRDLLLADIPGSKRINHVYCRDQFAYLSADFGVMIIDLQKREVKDSYFELGADGTTIIVNSATILNDSLYLATEEGIISGNLGDNLKDFNQWRRYGVSDGMPESPAQVIVDSSNGLLAAFNEAGLFEYSLDNWTNKNLLEDKDFLNGSYGNPGNLLVTKGMVYQYDDGALDSINFNLAGEPRAAIYFNDTAVVGDFNNGLVFPASQSSYYPNGPLSNSIVRLFGYEDKMVALPPAYDANFNPIKNEAGFFIFTDGVWHNYNSTGYPGTITIPEFLDISDAMYAYASERLYLASYGYGVMEVDNEQYTIFNDSNSSLINASPGNNVFVTALEANSRLLSVVNFNSTQPYHSLSFQDGLWNGQAVGFPASNTVQIRGFENNTYWLRSANRFSSGILVFDAENQRELILNTDYLPSSAVNDMAVDREGKMWVATDLGVVYFNNAANILDQSFIDPVLPVYEGQLLFRNEKLTALAVDGGNRIWMATTTGVWLFANDGFELISYFNTENSPLPSNNVINISINHQSGEVFFATDAGLVSYRGSATISAVEKPLKIFPNPVLRAQHDIVTIQGVPTDADFWITDSSGRLVYRGKASGNTATWAGLSSNAELSSGVYFVYVSTEDGSEKQVGKIAVVN